MKQNEIKLKKKWFEMKCNESNQMEWNEKQGYEENEMTWNEMGWNEM